MKRKKSRHFRNLNSRKTNTKKQGGKHTHGQSLGTKKTELARENVLGHHRARRDFAPGPQLESSRVEAHRGPQGSRRHGAWSRNSGQGLRAPEPRLKDRGDPCSLLQVLAEGGDAFQGARHVELAVLDLPDNGDLLVTELLLDELAVIQRH